MSDRAAACIKWNEAGWSINRPATIAAIEAAIVAAIREAEQARWRPASQPPDARGHYAAVSAGHQTTLWYEPLGDEWQESTGVIDRNITHWFDVPPRIEGGK